MENTRHTVTSELYEEQDNSTSTLPRFENNVVSVYKFHLPQKADIDEDGDLIVTKKSSSNVQKIEIEHSKCTTLKQVGEQLWRGAFLLADWIIFNSDLMTKSRKILELAAGVGLTGIVASIYAPIILTDIDSGNLLNLIKGNVERNKNISKFDVRVAELDFTKGFSAEISDALSDVEIILAADVIYDDTLTEALVKTFIKLLEKSPACRIIVALEKRYVFTIADLESCAPCLEYFKDCMKHERDLLKIESLSTDFPQYFEYDRVKELVLYEICSK